MLLGADGIGTCHFIATHFTVLVGDRFLPAPLLLEYRRVLLGKGPNVQRDGEALLNELDRTDDRIDVAWSAETEDRLAAYRKGEIRATPLAQVLAKYRV